MLDRMWIEDGYFWRESYLPKMRFPLTNYGLSIGLQAVGAIERLFRAVPVWRRVRPGRNHACDGV
jgi:hypothetical protein